MQKGYLLEFPCLNCQSAVQFSIFSLLKEDCKVDCSNCFKSFQFKDEVLIRQLRKFEKLCIQIHESEEILGNTSVGVNVGNNHVSIPYKLLLTRFNAQLELEIGGKPCKVMFRAEPILDINLELLKQS